MNPKRFFGILMKNYITLAKERIIMLQTLKDNAWWISILIGIIAIVISIYPTETRELITMFVKWFMSPTGVIIILLIIILIKQ